MSKRIMDGFGVHDRTFKVRQRIERVGIRQTKREVRNAQWGRGPLAGKTGNPFKDDPFFNPWAPGGDFNK